MKQFLSRLFSPQVDMEVISAYLHKLPEQITVSWKREGGFIVGEVSFLHFDPIYTQARTPKEFVKMVNDAIYISLDFKSDYIAFFHLHKDVYSPNAEQWNDLNDGTIRASSFGLASKLTHVPLMA